MSWGGTTQWEGVWGVGDEMSSSGELGSMGWGEAAQLEDG